MYSNSISSFTLHRYHLWLGVSSLNLPDSPIPVWHYLPQIFINTAVEVISYIQTLAKLFSSFYFIRVVQSHTIWTTVFCFSCITKNIAGISLSPLHEGVWSSIHCVTPVRLPLNFLPPPELAPFPLTYSISSKYKVPEAVLCCVCAHLLTMQETSGNFYSTLSEQNC